MRVRSILACGVCAVLCGGAFAHAAREDRFMPAGPVSNPPRLPVSITFDEGLTPDGATLANQYAGIGVTFAAGTGGATGVPDTPLTTEPLATNTDMTIRLSTGPDVGGGVTAPISGNLLHSFNGWLVEDGDSVFRINFATPISSISMDFGGLFDPATSGIHAVDGSNNVIASAFAPAIAGTETVTLTPGVPVSAVVVTMGDFFDWVGVDNITFEPVPEPGSLSLVAIGALGILRRRRA